MRTGGDVEASIATTIEKLGPVKTLWPWTLFACSLPLAKTDAKVPCVVALIVARSDIGAMTHASQRTGFPSYRIKADVAVPLPELFMRAGSGVAWKNDHVWMSYAGVPSDACLLTLGAEIRSLPTKHPTTRLGVLREVTLRGVVHHALALNTLPQR